MPLHAYIQSAKTTWRGLAAREEGASLCDLEILKHAWLLVRPVMDARGCLALLGRRSKRSAQMCRLKAGCPTGLLGGPPGRPSSLPHHTAPSVAASRNTHLSAAPSIISGPTTSSLCLYTVTLGVHCN